jgi:hypothetical protein
MIDRHHDIIKMAPILWKILPQQASNSWADLETHIPNSMTAYDSHFFSPRQEPPPNLKGSLSPKKIANMQQRRIISNN